MKRANEVQEGPFQQRRATPGQESAFTQQRVLAPAPVAGFEQVQEGNMASGLQFHSIQGYQYVSDAFLFCF